MERVERRDDHDPVARSFDAVSPRRLGHRPTFEVRLLGGLEVVIDGSAVVVARAKVGAILAMMALQPNTVQSADRLIDGLWGDAVPAGATPTLQSYISILRSLVEAKGGDTPQRVARRKPGYLLAIDPNDVDSLRFESLVGVGVAASATGDHRLASAHLRDGLGLWRGAALVDLSFAAFAQPEIARLDELRLRAFETCIDSELELGLHHQLVAELDALVSANPLRERLRAQQMLALYRSDRQADALRAYRDLRSTLAEELGIEPSAPLRHLEAQILQQSSGIDLRKASGAAVLVLPEVRPVPGPGSVPFPTRLLAPAWPTVGRYAELTWLHERADRSASGSRILELIVGAPGIGKSHLAGTFGRERALAGATILFGRCSESAGLLYAPFTEALRSALGDLDGNALRAMVGEQARDLALLLPELTQRFLAPAPLLSADGINDSNVRRHLLFDAVSQLLDRLAASAPVVLVIDDLHWADDSTISLIEHVLRRPTASRLLVVATVRPVWTADDPLGRAIHALDRDGRAHTTQLSGLSETDVGELVRSQGALIAMDDVDSPEVRMLTDRTDGNPYFVLEILRHLDGASIATHSRVLPPRVLELIQQRLALLDANSKRILEIAAIVGKQFDMDLCQAADPRGSDERAVLGALDQAVRADLIAEVPKAFGHYEFAQDLVRDAVVAGLSNTARRLAHRDVARALEGQHSTEPSQSGALARHWIAAGAGGDLARAVHWATEAGRHAETVAAWTDAVRWYELALDALADAPLADASTAMRCRGELLIQLYTAVWCATDGPADPAVVAEAMDIARSLDDAMLFTDAVLAWMLTAPRTETGAHVEILEEALTRIDRATRPDDPRLLRSLGGARVRLQAVLSEALAFAERGAEAVSVAREALADARRLDDPSLLAQVMDQLIAELPPWASAERQELILELRRSTPRNNPSLSMRVHHLEALVALECGDIEHFANSAAAHHLLAENIGKQRSRASAAQKNALAALLGGRLDEAATLARDVLTISSHPNFQQGQLCQIALIDRERDGLKNMTGIARSAIDEVAQAVPKSGRLGRQLSIAGTAGIVLLDCGDADGVRRAIDLFDIAGLASSTKNFTYTFGLAALGEIVAHEGTDREVIELVPLMASCLGRHASMLGIATLGSVERVHAMLLARTGDRDGARQSFRRAIEDHDRGGSVVLRARVRVDAAYWLSNASVQPQTSDRPDELDPARLLADAAPLIDANALTRLRRESERVRNTAMLSTPSA